MKLPESKGLIVMQYNCIIIEEQIKDRYGRTENNQIET